LTSLAGADGIPGPLRHAGDRRHALQEVRIRAVADRDQAVVPEARDHRRPSAHRTYARPREPPAPAHEHAFAVQLRPPADQPVEGNSSGPGVDQHQPAGVRESRAGRVVAPEQERAPPDALSLARRLHALTHERPAPQRAPQPVDLHDPRNFRLAEISAPGESNGPASGPAAIASAAIARAC
jgi:hypothetical protein